MSFRVKQRSGSRSVKKGTDADDSRQKREKGAVELRKKSREEQLAKRRSRSTVAAMYGPEVHEKLSKLPELVQMVNSSSLEHQLTAVQMFRKLLSIEHNPPIQPVIDSGVVPRLVQFLKLTDNPKLQFEAAWALTNIASGTTKDTRHIIREGAVPIFVQLLRSPHEDVREQAVWALGNIAGDSYKCRDLVLQHGAMPLLLELCQPDAKKTLLRNATWTLSNFCRGKPQPDFDQVKIALPKLSYLIWRVQDEEVLTDACWALSYLSDDTGEDNKKIQAVIGAQPDVTRKLVNLLMHTSPNVQTPALRTVGNIVTGNDSQTQRILECWALPWLLALLVNPKNRKSIRKEACWTISNITAGNPDQIQAVIDANIIPALVRVLRSDEFDIQKEAAWAISNATSGGKPHQIDYLVSQAVIPPLCELLKCGDPKIILVCLEGIENILKAGPVVAERKQQENRYPDYVEECGGVKTIENLQQHPNEKIWKQAQKIIQQYINEEGGNAQHLAPTEAAGGSMFAFGTQQSDASAFNTQFQF
eukprot:gb/GEZN01001807.1/.p1 GENE.gb/GEZN01001807.1/~~gb/GEZN01001807.1/.p1  ORF type:complete len:532 (-),score=75.38 gb/GEZN01001807.1/:1035-2630(-)